MYQKRTTSAYIFVWKTVENVAWTYSLFWNGNMTKMKKVSLILTTYNSKENFLKTYKSIRQQDYPDIEIVVVDGGSTDGTVSEIQKCAGQESGRMKWISEKDHGIYDAINKGIRLASGDLIAVFNDTFYTDSAVSKLVQAINSNGGYDGAHGDLVYCQNGKVKRYWKMGKGQIEDGWMPAHPTLLLKREVYERFGVYKTDYRCSSDYEFMVRILKDGGIHLAYVPEILVSMFYGGTSSNGLGAYMVSFQEACRALKENGVRHPYWISVKRTCRVLRQF